MQNSELTAAMMHPIILHRKSRLARLLTEQIHKRAKHAGPATTLSLLSISYYIIGAKRLVRSISRSCIICQRSYARKTGQQMAPLPACRTRPSPPFQLVGVDFAGPFLCRHGHTRRPVIVKTYAAVFVCMAVKAVHLELVSDLSAEAFLSSFKRFIARRGLPTTVYSDNGSNFVGAQRELQATFGLQGASVLQSFSANQGIDWIFSPGHAPHFGGLWEASVKLMKGLLCKTVGSHQLRFDKLTTILTEIEGVINSRPLSPLDSTPDDGIPALTPGHFLVGRPLLAPPTKAIQGKPSLLRRWNLVQHITDEIWIRWRREYLQLLQNRIKWRKPQHEVKPGDVVLLKDVELFQRQWPLARVESVYPGKDGHTRVVDVRANGHTYRRPIHLLVPLLSTEEEDSLAGEDVQVSPKK